MSRFEDKSEEQDMHSQRSSSRGRKKEDPEKKFKKYGKNFKNAYLDEDNEEDV